MKYVLASLALCAIVVFAAVPAAAKATKVVVYTAASMMANGQAVKGYCWTGSIATRRGDAFRCMVGNDIMDPCFALSRKVVACPDNLVADTGTLIRLTKPLPPNPGPKTGMPWTMQLAGGITCNVGTGTVIGNYPFYCSGNIVCSVPNASAKMPAVYVVHCGKPAGPITVKGVRTISVMTMWE